MYTPVTLEQIKEIEELERWYEYYLSNQRLEDDDNWDSRYNDYFPDDKNRSDADSGL